MFTGLIENKGKVLSNQSLNHSNRLVIAANLEKVQIGESIAVNGVCLTLLPSEAGTLDFDVSPETLKLTTLGNLLSEDVVNLEQSVNGMTRFGGHYVSGHVEAVAKVHSVVQIDSYKEVKLSGFDAQSMLFLIPKGSITVDGISLTINAVEERIISLMLVPHTLSHTTLGQLKIDQEVNIEFDYLTRIIAHQLQIAGKLNTEVPL